MPEIEKIGVLTSGGDAPGMNACIRGVVRTAVYYDIAVVGIMRGYAGLIEGELIDMSVSSVSNIIQRGGTILKTARSEEFKTEEGRAKAAENLDKWDVDGLITIGGNGTYRGASDLKNEYGIPVMGVPGTIDNDICGTDFTIGYDTATNIALEAVDRIRDTAASHERVFFIEVMGRDSGFIALDVGLAGGAEVIIIPEEKNDLDEMCEFLVKGRARGKESSIVIVSEGAQMGGAYKVAEKVKEKTGLEYRVTILGHIQRGGCPTVRDRVLASRLGASAVDALKDGIHNVMVGELNGEIEFTPIENIWIQEKNIEHSLWELAKILAI